MVASLRFPEDSMKSIIRTGALAACLLAAAVSFAQDPKPVEATTSTGEKVLLYPNGRWEFVDRAKQAEAKKVADTYPENQVRPEGAQGGWLFGRTIKPGEADYNRGSMSGKGR